MNTNGYQSVQLCCAGSGALGSPNGSLVTDYGSRITASKQDEAAQDEIRSLILNPHAGQVPPRCAIRATGGPNPDGARDKRAMGAGSFTARRGRGGRRTCRHMRTQRASAARQPDRAEGVVRPPPPLLSSVVCSCLLDHDHEERSKDRARFLPGSPCPTTLRAYVDAVAWGMAGCVRTRARVPPARESSSARLVELPMPVAYRVRCGGTGRHAGSRDVIAGPGHPVASSAPTCPAHSAPACPEPPSADTRIWPGESVGHAGIARQSTSPVGL